MMTDGIDTENDRALPNEPKPKHNFRLARAFGGPGAESKREDNDEGDQEGDR